MNYCKCEKPQNPWWDGWHWRCRKDNGVFQPSVESRGLENAQKSLDAQKEQIDEMHRANSKIIFGASHPHSSIGWRERFDEIVPYKALFAGDHDEVAVDPNDIKSFIAQVEAEARRESQTDYFEAGKQAGRTAMYIEICELLKKEGTNSARQRKILQNCIEEVRASKGDDGQ